MLEYSMKYQIIKSKVCVGKGHSPLNMCIWDSSNCKTPKECKHLFDNVNAAYHEVSVRGVYSACCCELGVIEVED